MQFPFHFLHIHQSTSQVNLVPVIAWQLSGKAGYYQCQERLVLDARTPVSRAKFDYSTHHLHILSLFFLVFKVASNFEKRSIVQALIIRFVDLEEIRHLLFLAVAFHIT